MGACPVEPHTDTALARKHFNELRDTWQVRALVATRHQHVGVILLSVLAHTFDEAMPVMLRVAFPGFMSITPPFLSTCGKVGKHGEILADVVNNNDTISKDVCVYRNEIDLRDDFRRVADNLKLNDYDRKEMFMCVRKWVVADRRIDPTMDPQDPDAKRMLQ